MFRVKTNKTSFQAAISMLTVIYHATVFDLRKSHTNAVMALLLNIAQTLILVGVFFLMMSVLGMRKAAIRGDFLLYIMSGIFVFMANVRTMRSVSSAGGPVAAMLLHSPMNTMVMTLAKALSSLYIQVVTVFVVLLIYGLAVNPVEIHDPVGTFMMLLLAWFNGISVGLVFQAIRPWFPQTTDIGTTFYMRINMFASGKMFVANSLPFFMLALFSWNPLFHIIDQVRGFAFINYFPHHSSWQYPLIVSVVLAILGLMGESYSRKYVSASWDARR